MQYFKQFPMPVFLQNVDILESLSTLIVFLFCALIMPKANAEVYHICGASHGGSALSVPNNVSCILPTLLESSELEVSLGVWVPNVEPTTVRAAKCYIRMRTICTNTGFLEPNLYFMTPSHRLLFQWIHVLLHLIINFIIM